VGDEDLIQHAMDNENSGAIRWLPAHLIVPWWQNALILFLTFGYSAYISNVDALKKYQTHFSHQRFGYLDLLWILAVESGLFSLFIFYLWWAGWKASNFEFTVSLRSSLHGALLLVTQLFAGFVVFKLSEGTHISLPMSMDAHDSHLQHGETNLLLIILSQIINSLFEECVFLGYAFRQFAAKGGAFFAFLLTIFLRLCCHTWQGPVFIWATGVAFVAYGCYYWYYRNLWPVMLAHTCFDFILLASQRASFQ
jgi:membrane protease YdiL (CAAX protease family)